MSGPPPETIHDGHRHKPSPRRELQISDPVGNQTRAAGFNGRDSTDNATAADIISVFKISKSIRSQFVHGLLVSFSLENINIPDLIFEFIPEILGRDYNSILKCNFNNFSSYRVTYS